MQVLERRQGVNMRVNMKKRGDCFGEVSLMYNCARSATVAATSQSVVWVLERDVFRCALMRTATLTYRRLHVISSFPSPHQYYWRRRLISHYRNMWRPLAAPLYIVSRKREYMVAFGNAGPTW